MFLLDTHVFLWWRARPRRLEATVRDAIGGADVVFVSAATAWEAAIKLALGRREDLTLVTLDRRMAAYDRRVLWT